MLHLRLHGSKSEEIGIFQANLVESRLEIGDHIVASPHRVNKDGFASTTDKYVIASAAIKGNFTGTDGLDYVIKGVADTVRAVALDNQILDVVGQGVATPICDNRINATAWRDDNLVRTRNVKCVVASTSDERVSAIPVDRVIPRIADDCLTRSRRSKPVLWRGAERQRAVLVV